MKSKVACIVAVASLALNAQAADFTNFPPTNLPYGYIAPVALSDYNIGDGTAQLYRPWFHSGTYHGDLKAHAIASTGAVGATQIWSAKDQLETLTSGTGWSSRKLFTNSDATTSITYGCEGGSPTNEIRFICGDSSIEDGISIRNREAALGDIVHSQPVYTGHPEAGYTFNDYLSFANTWKDRVGRVYVGANDGMLHAFDASNGNELWGYIPSTLSPKLTDLDAVTYSHQYFVDGQLAVADAYADYDSDSSSEWGTVLVGTLGAGGKSIFALNVTDPTAADLNAAKGKFLWEFTTGSDADLGYSYSKPVIARLSTGGWGVIVGNGYSNSGDGKAHLYILDIANGSLIRDIPLGTSTSNGLSSPAVIDTDGDFKVDTVYAGDLDGNLWKIDISDGSDTSNWGIDNSLSGAAMLTALDGSTNPQPITNAPDVFKHPDGGYQVVVGTGETLASSGSLTLATHHSIYGVRDYGLSTSLTRSDLVAQTISAISGYPNYNTITSNAVDYASKKGWYIDLGSNEHLLQSVLARDSRAQLMISDRTSGAEKNWLTQIDYLTGGLPDTTVYDLNNDGLLDDTDNPDYVSSGAPGTRIIGISNTADLASSAMVARGNSRDHSFVNIWTEQASVVTPGPVTCSMLWIDLRYQKSFDTDSNLNRGVHSISFTGTFDDGSVVDLKMSNLKFKLNAVYNKSDCDADALCIHGGGGVAGGDNIDLNFNRPNSDEASLTSPTGNGVDASIGALGLRWDPSHIDLHRSNESFAIGIQFHSNLRLDNYSIDFDWTGVTGQSVRRIELASAACGADFTSDVRVLKDQDVEDDVDQSVQSIFSWDGTNQKMTINNSDPNSNTMVLNGDGDSAADLANSGVVVDGATEQIGQDSNDEMLGRILWRELLF